MGGWRLFKSLKVVRTRSVSDGLIIKPVAHAPGSPPIAHLYTTMQNFVRGQRAAIDKICDSTNLGIQISLHSARVPVFDFVCFGLDEREQLTDDRYMVFFNQKSAPDGAITLDNLGDQTVTFSVDLAKVPPAIARLVFTISVDGAGALRDLQTGVFALHCGDSADVAMEYRFSGTDFQNEGALMLAALYRKDGVWRVWAQGQGFAGDLSALLQHFGGEEAAENSPPTPRMRRCRCNRPRPISPPVALSTCDQCGAVGFDCATDSSGCRRAATHAESGGCGQHRRPRARRTSGADLS